MNILIDVPEETYKALCNGNMLPPDVENVVHAIKNGTSLPKGHGRLIDADALENDMINGIKAGNYEEGYAKYAHINNMDDCVDCVKYRAPTIIEADKEGEKCR